MDQDQIALLIGRFESDIRTVFKNIKEIKTSIGCVQKKVDALRLWKAGVVAFAVGNIALLGTIFYLIKIYNGVQ